MPAHQAMVAVAYGGRIPVNTGDRARTYDLRRGAWLIHENQHRGSFLVARAWGQPQGGAAAYMGDQDQGTTFV
ncbi:MAG: hypothetical protein ACR2PK_06035 [Acidimicrobiales bacterium]